MCYALHVMYRKVCSLTSASEPVGDDHFAFAPLRHLGWCTYLKRESEDSTGDVLRPWIGQPQPQWDLFAIAPCSSQFLVLSMASRTSHTFLQPDSPLTHDGTKLKSTDYS